MKIQVQVSTSGPIRAIKKKYLEKKATFHEREWWKKMSVEEQRDYLQEHPDSKLAEHHNGIIKNLTHIAVSKAVGSIRKNRLEFSEGIDGLKNFKHGRPLSDSQKEGLKKIAIVGATVLIVGLAALAMFTPLAGHAQEVASKFMDSYLNKTPTGEASADTDSEDGVADFLSEMSEWLKKQDVSKLVKGE